LLPAASDAKRWAQGRATSVAAMQRAAMLLTPMASQVFSLLDAVWFEDPRVAQIQDLDYVA